MNKVVMVVGGEVSIAKREQMYPNENGCKVIKRNRYRQSRDVILSPANIKNGQPFCIFLRKTCVIFVTDCRTFNTV